MQTFTTTLDNVFNDIFDTLLTTTEVPLYVTSSNYGNVIDSLVNSEIPYNQFTKEDGTIETDFAMAGVDSKDIEIEKKGRLITISIKGKESSEKIAYIHKAIKLPPNKDKIVAKWEVAERFDLDKGEFNYSNGLLKIILPLKEEEKPVTIKIK